MPSCSPSRGSIEGDKDAAREHVDASLSLKPSWAGYRLQALLSADVDAASENYLKAWRMGDAPPELAVEIATHFMTARAVRRAQSVRRCVAA